MKEAILVVTRFASSLVIVFGTSENEKRQNDALGAAADCLLCQIDETSGIRCVRHVCVLFVACIWMS